MRNSDTSLEEAAEGIDEQAQPVDHDPAAAGKSGDGTASQDQGHHDTEPTEADEIDADLRAEFVSDDGDNGTEEPSGKPPEEPEPTTTAQPPKDDQAEQPSDDRKPPEEQKPQEQDADRKPDEPTDEELKRYHPHARARIKNLAQERRRLTDEVQTHRVQSERATKAVKALEDHALAAGFTRAEDLMAGVSLLGRAMHQGDAAAKAEIAAKLGIVPALPPEIEEVLSEAEAFGIDTSKVRERIKAPGATQAPAVQPPAKPTEHPPAPPAQPAAPAQPVAQGMNEVAAFHQSISREHGANAPEIMRRIEAEVTAQEREAERLTGAKIPPSRWKSVLEAARAKVLAAQASRTRGSPPPLRPSAPNGGKSTPADDMEAALRRDYVAG